MKKSISLALAGSLALGTVVPFTGCEQVQENPRTSGAVIGGLGGAAAGALIGGEENRTLGALLGGALGAGGGYLIGSSVGRDEDDRDEAIQASQEAQQDPATAADVSQSQTADLNNDGFVTMDEVVAMENADLSNQEMIRRLRATGQVFALTPQQEQFLRDRGVDNSVIDAMGTMNRTPAAQPAGAEEMDTDVIGRDADDFD